MHTCFYDKTPPIGYKPQEKGPDDLRKNEFYSFFLAILLTRRLAVKFHLGLVRAQWAILGDHTTRISRVGPSITF